VNTPTFLENRTGYKWFIFSLLLEIVIPLDESMALDRHWGTYKSRGNTGSLHSAALRMTNKGQVTAKATAKADPSASLRDDK
jgi:hypothetical protein